MCGRYTLGHEPASLMDYFQLHGEVPYYHLSWNIAPSQHVPVIINDPDKGRICLLMHWGFVPHWANQIDTKYKMINARAESIADKPAYRDAFRYHRCLVLADGFYEWQQTERGKQPYYIYMQDQRCFAMAGVWSTWQSAEQTLYSFSIITTTANPAMQRIHERMPVILPEQVYDQWLTTQAPNVSQLHSLLVPYARDDLGMHPVSKAVNSPKNQGRELVQATDQAELNNQ